MFIMKNLFNSVFAVSVLLFLVFGCSFYNSNKTAPPNEKDKTFSDQAIDSTVGEEKIGVAECDEIVDFFVEQSKSKDEDFVTKAARGYALNKIRESFRKSIEEHKGDTAAMAKECREFKQQLDKYKSEDDAKKK